MLQLAFYKWYMTGQAQTRCTKTMHGAAMAVKAMASNAAAAALPSLYEGRPARVRTKWVPSPPPSPAAAYYVCMR